MKVVACLFIIALFSSCCFTSQKCDVAVVQSPALRIVNANGQDLVFGSSHIYDKNAVKAYSLTANDTLFHYCQPGAYSGDTPQDSVLFLWFNNTNPGTVYLALSNTDTDTLTLTYQTTTTKCCGSYTNMSSLRYNNKLLQAVNGIMVVEK